MTVENSWLYTSIQLLLIISIISINNFVIWVWSEFYKKKGIVCYLNEKPTRLCPLNEFLFRNYMDRSGWIIDGMQFLSYLCVRPVANSCQKGKFSRMFLYPRNSFQFKYLLLISYTRRIIIMLILAITYQHSICWWILYICIGRFTTYGRGEG